MPKIIRGGVNYTPEVEVPQADGITIIDSEGIFSAIQPEIPQADGVTIISSEGIFSAVKQNMPQPD